MKISKLYHYITLFKRRFIGKQSDDKAFTLYELPKTKPFNITVNIAKKPMMLRLDSHHISFYNLIDPKKKTLSEYHYTA